MRKYNDHKKKKKKCTNNDSQNVTQKTNDSARRTLQKTGFELMYSVSVISSCSSSRTVVFPEFVLSKNKSTTSVKLCVYKQLLLQYMNAI